MTTRTAIRPPYGYYRKPNGWIGVAVQTAIEVGKYQREGWQLLSRYGRFDFVSGYAVEHPFEGLFLGGGAHEMSVEQLINTGYAADPPLLPTCGQLLTQYHKEHLAECWEGAQPVVFPQLQGVDVPPPVPCRFCDARKPTERARDQHEMVMHKDVQANIMLGETLAKALGRELRGQGESIPTGRDDIWQQLRDNPAAKEALLRVLGLDSNKPASQESKKSLEEIQHASKTGAKRTGSGKRHSAGSDRP